jgi:hypothetical protein
MQLMNNYKWKLIEVTAENDLVTHVYYHVTATDGENSVETEGNHYFKGKEAVIPYAEIREQTILNWINEETTVGEVSSIKSCLDKQLLELKKDKTVGFPWLSNTFTPNI